MYIGSKPIVDVVSMPSSANQALQAKASNGVLSFDEYYRKYYSDSNPFSLPNRIGNWFTGNVDAAKQSYDNYLTAHDQEREDTSYQRTFKDIIAGGYNPYMALGSISPASSAQSYKRNKKEETDSKLVSSALKILTLMLLKGLK